MIGEINPGFILLASALVALFLRPGARALWCLGAPLVALVHFWGLGEGAWGHPTLFGLELTLMRVDGLSRIFGTIFLIAAALNAVYGAHDDDRTLSAAALAYAGGATGAVFAGDLISFFVWWEVTALASVFIVWGRKSEGAYVATPRDLKRAYAAGLRYLSVSIISGVLLLIGVAMHVQSGGGLAFDQLAGRPLDWLTATDHGASGLALTPATTFILLGIGIKAAFPLLHNWLQDAYPEATSVGSVVLSAFATKLAIYALARGFHGLEPLIYVGAIMTAFPVFFAVIENDLRRVLAFSLNNQLGFMVAAIGVGTAMAVNGAAAHAFAHILYKALLFMSMGAVLYRAGTVQASELGGLARRMPWTTAFCIVGAMSISAFPLFSGFVAKSLTMTAAAEAHYVLAWLTLLFASAGVLEHSGIKIPYFAFFAHDNVAAIEKRIGGPLREAPANMVLAMAIAAGACILLGVAPSVLYGLVPYPDAVASPYDAAHVTSQLQLLLFAGLAFVVLVRLGLYPPELPSTNLNTDWIYRRALPWLGRGAQGAWMLATARLSGLASQLGRAASTRLYADFGPRGMLARTWSLGVSVLVVAALLGATLISYFVDG